MCRPKKKILIVEDDPLIQSMLDEMIKVFNYNTITCKDRDTAIEILDQEIIAMIIMDHYMSGMKLDEFLRRVDNLHQDHLIIFTSGSRDVEIIARLNQTNRFFLPKPFDLHMLKDTLNKIEEISRDTMIVEEIENPSTTEFHR